MHFLCNIWRQVWCVLSAQADCLSQRAGSSSTRHTHQKLKPHVHFIRNFVFVVLKAPALLISIKTKYIEKN